MMLSIVNLGDINQRYGFANGDQVLYNTANRIADFLGERKLTRVPIAHFKGGEFIIALEGTQEQYRSLMDVLCVKFQHFNLEDIEVNIVGSMTDSTRTNAPEKIIEWLYELQNENRKMLQESEEEEVDPDTIERLVIDAVEARSFSYRYQAAYRGDKVLLYEMAVKLVSGDGKLVHQKRFMPVINRLGLLRQFDEIQTEAALAEIPRLDEGQKIAVNVSPSSLRNPLFFDHIMMLMSNNERLKDRLIFIISENNYFHQVQQFNTRLQAFRRAGICIALDRLGGLHASLRYLHDLEVDAVRFESYLGKTATDAKTRAVLEGLQHTVKALGCESWIRMVEDEAGYEAVKNLGIDILQGNFLSPIDTIKE